MLLSKYFKVLVLVVILSVTTISLFCIGDTDHDLIIRKINIEGNDFFSARQIRSMIESRSSGFFSRYVLRKEEIIYNRYVLERDIESIKNHYQRNGFLFVQVESDTVFRTKRKVDILVTVTENDFIRIGEIDFIRHNSDDEEPAPEKDLFGELRQKLKREISLKTGVRFNDKLVFKSIDIINEFYQDKSYPFNIVDYKLNLESDKRLCHLSFLIEPGPLSYFGETGVIGNEKTDSELIEKKVIFEEGDLFDRKMLRLTQRNISRLALFRSVSISPDLRKRQPDIPINVIVNELPDYSYRVGLGYGREDLFRTFFELSRIRFFGGARRIVFYAKHSYLEPFNLDVKFFQPMILDTDIDFTWNPYFRREREPSFNIERTGTIFSFFKPLSLVDNVSLSYNFENIRHLKIDENEIDLKEDTQYRKSSISAAYLRDTATPVFYPSEGISFSLNFTLSGVGFGSQHQFFKTIAEFKTYHEMSGFLVAAFRLKAGNILLLRDKDTIPREDRLYSGGLMSVRGWKRSMLGPLDSEGLPVGGSSNFEANIELRYPVWKIISGAVFLDAGNVWPDPWDHSPADLRFAAGKGIRFKTPLGPISLDAGRPVFDDEKHWNFYFNVGQSF